MKIIVGLGNPGEKYEKTRHNIGFLALDELLSKLESLKQTFWEDEKDLKAQIKQIKQGDTTLLLVKPTTFMNNSGFAVAKVMNYYKLTPEDVIVIHDDLDLPLGKIRIRFGGAAGGHHGVESLIEQLKTDKFLRIRLGIGHPRDHEGRALKNKNYQNVDDFVLGTIHSDERGKIKSMIKQSIKDVELILKHGIDDYMSKYNK